MPNFLTLTIGALGVATFLIHYRHLKKKRRFENLIPYIEVRNGDVKKLERFGDYVVRQLGITRDENCVQSLVRLAEGYLKGDKSSNDESTWNITMFLKSWCHDVSDIDSLNKEMLEELDACMLSYFAFHWDHAPFMIRQVLNKGESNKLRKAVLRATRERRLQNVTKLLKTRFVLGTVVEQLKAIARSNSSIQNRENILIPADATVRSPVLLLIGGGMGAGKSTAVKDMMKCSFWSGVAQNAVVVEADAFKETALVCPPLSLFEDSHLAEAYDLVHQLSTDAASSLLVTALNEGRDIIFDGTMSWEPFVLQTIEMVRDIHERRYRMGPGYHKRDDGHIEEKYWEPIEGSNPSEKSGTLEGSNEVTGSDAIAMDEKAGTDTGMKHARKPYRIELVGVVCDAHLAVVRGMRRAILTKRTVPVEGQLRSHKLFATSLRKYCELVDHAKIYSTNSIGGPAELIGWKDVKSKLLVDCKAFKAVTALSSLNPNAKSLFDLYSNAKEERFNRIWKEVVLAPERKGRQDRLRKMLQNYCSSDSEPSVSYFSSASLELSRQSSSSSISEDISSHSN